MTEESYRKTCLVRKIARKACDEEAARIPPYMPLVEMDPASLSDEACVLFWAAKQEMIRLANLPIPRERDVYVSETVGKHQNGQIATAPTTALVPEGVLPFTVNPGKPLYLAEDVVRAVQLELMLENALTVRDDASWRLTASSERSVEEPEHVWKARVDQLTHLLQNAQSRIRGLKEELSAIDAIPEAEISIESQLVWDEVFANVDDIPEDVFVRAESLVSLLLRKSRESKRNGLESCQPSDRKAYYSFKLAEAKAGRRLEDLEAWKLLSEHDWSEDYSRELDGYTLPKFDTWSRALRKARGATGEQKYTPRTRR